MGGLIFGESITRVNPQPQTLCLVEVVLWPRVPSNCEDPVRPVKWFGPDAFYSSLPDHYHGRLFDFAGPSYGISTEVLDPWDTKSEVLNLRPGTETAQFTWIHHKSQFCWNSLNDQTNSLIDA